MKAGVKEGDRIIKVSGPARPVLSPRMGPGAAGRVGTAGSDPGSRFHAPGLSQLASS